MELLCGDSLGTWDTLDSVQFYGSYSLFFLIEKMNTENDDCDIVGGISSL